MVDKEYLALVDGRPPTPNGRVEVAIGRDPKISPAYGSGLERDGKEAISEYFTLEEFPKHTYVKSIDYDRAYSPDPGSPEFPGLSGCGGYGLWQEKSFSGYPAPIFTCFPTFNITPGRRRETYF